MACAAGLGSMSPFLGVAMGHLVFVGIHLVAFLFIGAKVLMLTIPAHLVYGAIRGNRRPSGPAEDDGEHVRCPACRELVRWDATRCRHCQGELTPLAQSPREALPFYKRKL